MASPEFLAHKREKAFPLHYDAWGYYPDHHAARVELDTGLPDAVVAALPAHPLREAKHKHLYRKIKAAFNDPICSYALIDILLQMQRGIYIRPGYIKDLLNNRWPQYVWSNQLLGRMLGGLCTHVQKVYSEVDEREAPIARGRDSKGNYWVIDPKGGNEGLLWLVRAREVFLTLSEDIMAREAVMRVEALEESTHDYQKPEEFYEDVLSFRIRQEPYYQASWRPDSEFGRTSLASRPIKSPYGD